MSMEKARKKEILVSIARCVHERIMEWEEGCPLKFTDQVDGDSWSADIECYLEPRFDSQDIGDEMFPIRYYQPSIDYISIDVCLYDNENEILDEETIDSEEFTEYYYKNYEE